MIFQIVDWLKHSTPVSVVPLAMFKTSVPRVAVDIKSCVFSFRNIFEQLPLQGKFCRCQTQPSIQWEGSRPGTSNLLLHTGNLNILFLDKVSSLPESKNKVSSLPESKN